MAKDYAARNKRARKEAAGVPGWIWLVAGLSIGLAVAAFVYITRPTSPMPMAPGGREARTEAPTANPAVKVPPKTEARFDFYKLLKKEKVVVPPENTEDAGRTPIGALPRQESPRTSTRPAQQSGQKPSSKTEAGSFWVIAGAYRQLGNADEQRARLAFLGIESQIETTTSAKGDRLHRVTVGPELRREQAESILAELKANGFKGLVVRR